jgi:putative lipoprotein
MNVRCMLARPRARFDAALLTVLLLGIQATRVRADDAWLAPDKGLHFGVSLGLAASGYGLSSLVLEEPRYRALVGFSFALSLGLVKEAWDAAGHGDASWRDVTWDILGGLSGTALAWGIDVALQRARARGRASKRGSRTHHAARAEAPRALYHSSLTRPRARFDF